MWCGVVFIGFMHLHHILRFPLLRTAPAPATIKIGFGAVWYQCGVGAVLRFGLDSFGSDWASPNVNFNLKIHFYNNSKNLANYSIQI
jgi:hypothetical protein